MGTNTHYQPKHVRTDGAVCLTHPTYQPKHRRLGLMSGYRPDEYDDSRR